MTTEHKPFDVAGFFELTAKQAEEEVPLLKSQAAWFRLLADLIEQHKSIDDVATALVDSSGADGGRRLNIRFEIDKSFSHAMMMKILTIEIDKQIAGHRQKNHKA